MRKRGRVDLNQKAIVRAARQMGCSVQILAAVGHGVPDLLIGVAGKNLLWEVKNPEGGKLNADQIIWHESWRGSVQVVKSVEHAIRIINHARSGLMIT